MRYRSFRYFMFSAAQMKTNGTFVMVRILAEMNTSGLQNRERMPLCAIAKEISQVFKNLNIFCSGKRKGVRDGLIKVAGCI